MNTTSETAIRSEDTQARRRIRLYEATSSPFEISTWNVLPAISFEIYRAVPVWSCWAGIAGWCPLVTMRVRILENWMRGEYRF